MKLNIVSKEWQEKHAQADPFVFEYAHHFYMYVTGRKGVEAYEADDLFGVWHYVGIVFTYGNYHSYWAPSVIALEDGIYMYVSCECAPECDEKGHWQAMCVGKAETPLGPFHDIKRILPAFSIDSHAVKTESGLFLFYSTNDFESERPGTYIVVDKMLDPYTPAGHPKPVVRPTLDREIYSRTPAYPGRYWHTIEGAFYFRQGDWHYCMYSGSAFGTEDYFVGYAAAHTAETDLTKIEFQKMPSPQIYAPILCKNEQEEGTGHNSVIFYHGAWYAVYHGRDYGDHYAGDRRTARICKLKAENGILCAMQKEEVFFQNADL